MTTEEAREQQEDAYLNVFWSEDGSLELHGRLAPEDGALLLRALDAMRDLLWQAGGGSAEPRPETNAEALVAVADASLTRPEAGRSGGERCQVVVHVDEQALSNDGEGGCELLPETARRLACDASLIRNGRKTRTIPPALRRALRARDRGVASRLREPPSTPTTSTTGREAVRRRLTTSCCSAPATTASSTRAATASTTACGSPTPGGGRSVRPLPRGDPDDLVKRNRDLEIDARTCESGTGEALDLAYVVDVLLAGSK